MFENEVIVKQLFFHIVACLHLSALALSILHLVTYLAIMVAANIVLLVI